jgi:hypothetical protein
VRSAFNAHVPRASLLASHLFLILIFLQIVFHFHFCFNVILFSSRSPPALPEQGYKPSGPVTHRGQIARPAAACACPKT